MIVRVAFFGSLIRRISFAVKEVVTACGLSTKHWLSFAVAGGTGVGDGLQAGASRTKPLAAPMYSAACPNDSASPTSAAVGGPPRRKPVTAKLDRTRVMSLRE